MSGSVYEDWDALEKLKEKLDSMKLKGGKENEERQNGTRHVVELNKVTSKTAFTQYPLRPEGPAFRHLGRGRGRNTIGSNPREEERVQVGVPLQRLNLTAATFDPIVEEVVQYCICDRKAGGFRCGNCDYMGKPGLRVKRKCSVHPKRMYTTDLDACPGCKNDLSAKCELPVKTQTPTPLHGE